MLPPSELSEFIATFAGFQQRLGELIDTTMQTSLAVGGGRWLDVDAHPRLQAMRAAVEAGLDRLEREQPLLALATELQQLIAAQAETVALHDDGVRVEVPLRRYLEVALWPELEPAFVTLGHTLAAVLQDSNRRIAEVQRTLDYYVLAVQRHATEREDAEAEELARTGSDRVEQLLVELQRSAAARARGAKLEFIERSAAALQDACAPYCAHRPDELLRRLAEHDRTRETGPVQPGPARRALQQLERSYRSLLPIAGQLATELRTLGAVEQLREPEAPPLTDPTELGGKLPLGYRRLFTSKALDSAELYVARPALEREYADAITRWASGLPQWLLVHGDRGAGKRTLTNHVLARMCSEFALDVQWVRLGPHLRDEASVVQQLARALGCPDEPRTFAELSAAATQLSPPHGRRRAIVVENAERMLAPSAAGLARMGEFLTLLHRSASAAAWLVLMATPAATVILHRLGFADRIPAVLQVPSMSADELRLLIAARHRLSGFELELDAGHRRLLDRLARLRAPSISEIFHRQLQRITGGNPRQALYTWLACARPDPRREGRIVVETPRTASERLPAVALEQRLILALLAQHGSLSGTELVTALAVPNRAVEGDLGALRARGLLIPSREHEQHWTLPPTLAHPLVMELRSVNLI